MTTIIQNIVKFNSRTFEIFYQTKVNTSVENESKRAITQDPGNCNQIEPYKRSLVVI